MLKSAHAGPEGLRVTTQEGTDIIAEALEKAHQEQRRDLYFFSDKRGMSFTEGVSIATSELRKYYNWAKRMGIELPADATVTEYVRWGAGLHKSGLLFFNRCPTREEINRRVENPYLDQSTDWHGEVVAGHSVSTRELREAHVSYNMRGEESSFREEVLTWLDQHGRKVVVRLDGELHGVRETEDTHGPQNQEFEPLVVEEALEFIEAVNGDDWDVSDIKAGKRDPHALLSYLKVAVEYAQEIRERIAESNGHQLRWQKTFGSPGPNKEKAGQVWKRGLDKQGVWSKPRNVEMEKFPFDVDLPRARVCVSRWSLHQIWNHGGVWFIGERAGVVEDLSAQNDENYTRLEQEIEGAWQEELDFRAAGDDNLFDQLFFRGGEKLRTPRRDGRTHALPGENRMWSDWHVYIKRQSHLRAERTADLLWKILTYPLEDVQEHLSNNGGVIRQRYVASVKSCSPGPISRRVNGQWKALPLTGQQAYQAILARGINSWKLPKSEATAGLQHLTPQTKFWRGESWHKLYLDGKQMQLLQEAINRRLGTAVYSLHGHTYKVPVKTYQGMLREQTVKPASVIEQTKSIMNEMLRQQLREAWSHPLHKMQTNAFRLHGNWRLEEAIAMSKRI